MADVPFSKRQNHFPKREPITVNADAPPELRRFVMYAAHQHLGYLAMYVAISDVLNVPTRGRYISEESCHEDAEQLVTAAPWFRVYDIIERFWVDTYAKRGGAEGAAKFTTKVNDFLVDNGLGWQLVNGEIVTRGDEAFDTVVNTARAELAEAGRPTAARRIYEALQDLSRRPEADYAGAISHAITALECVAVDIAGLERATLGDLLKIQDLFPSSLRKTIEGVWAYACNEGARHGKEGKEPGRDEAELIVGLSATVATYLNRKKR
jgi:hypothetical protein